MVQSIRTCFALVGNGVGRGTHISLYLQICRGNYDKLLQWPFQHQVNTKLKLNVLVRQTVSGTLTG